MLGDQPNLLEWITHPWVHQSAYHLLLDGSAFLALWGMLSGSVRHRWGLLAAANLGSAASVWITGTGAAGAFGGLSGIAHGLMAAIAVDWMRDPEKRLRKPGAGLLILVLGKALIETATGQPFFSSLHLGDIGTPLVICHLGGILGALAFQLIPLQRKNSSAIHVSGETCIAAL
jgi:membrane associated rhomboid family serine protease